MVQGRAAEHVQPLSRLLRLACGPAPGHLRQGGLPLRGGQHLEEGRHSQASGTCTTSTPTSPISTSPTPRCATRSPSRSGCGSRSGSTVSAWTRRRSSWRTSRQQADHVPGDPHAFLKDLRGFLGRRRGDAVLLGEVNLPRAEQKQLLRWRARATSCRCSSTSSPCRGCISRWRVGMPVRWPRPCAAGRRSRTGLPVGDLRAQPRRADAGQALLQPRARLCGPWPGSGDAGVRPRPQAQAAAHARRRPPSGADGLQPPPPAARNADPLLRRGDRHGGGP